jgi:hypothetical protein
MCVRVCAYVRLCVCASVRPCASVCFCASVCVCACVVRLCDCLTNVCCACLGLITALQQCHARLPCPTEGHTMKATATIAFAALITSGRAVSLAPTVSQTAAPTMDPTSPTAYPTLSPTTAAPTAAPTFSPTLAPSFLCGNNNCDPTAESIETCFEDCYTQASPDVADSVTLCPGEPRVLNDDNYTNHTNSVLSRIPPGYPLGDDTIGMLIANQVRTGHVPPVLPHDISLHWLCDAG